MTRDKRIAVLVAGTLGVVLVVGAALVKWVAAPALVKEPLTIPSAHTTTVATGNAQVFTLLTQSLTSEPVVATRVVTGDKSAGNGSVAVWNETLCLAAAGTVTDSSGCALPILPGYILKSTDRVAIDRKTAEAVNNPKYQAAVNGDTSVTHSGVDYTFPIGTKKQTYQMFDAIAGKAFPAQYVGTSKLDGLKVYEFRQQIPASPIKIAGLLPGTYTDQTTVFVEPTTGVIIKGVQSINEKFASTGQTVFNGTLTFNNKSVASQASYAKSQRSQISLVRVWLPLILLVLGVVLLVVALLLGRRRAGPVPAEPVRPVPYPMGPPAPAPAPSTSGQFADIDGGAGQDGSA